MNNLNLIRDISTQLKVVCDKIASLSCGMEFVGNQDESLEAVYEELLLDEVHHAQVLALEMTRVTIGPEEENTAMDESAFAEGELNSVVGEKEKEAEESAPVSG